MVVIAHNRYLRNYMKVHGRLKSSVQNNDRFTQSVGGLSRETKKIQNE